MTMRIRVLPRFPALITGDAGIKVVRDGVDLVVQPDYGALTQVPSVVDPDTNFFSVWNEDDDMYARMSFGDVFDAVSGLGFMQTETYDPQGIGADAFDRGNHTGEQAISTVTGLQAALNAKASSSDLTTSLAEKLDHTGGNALDLTLAPSASPTKKLAFNLAAITAGQTRTITMPDADVDLSKLGIKSGVAQTASGTAIDFTSIPDGVKRVTVAYAGLSENGTSPIIVQLGDSGGVENSSYLGAVSNIVTTVSSDNFSSGIALHPSVIAANTLHGHITFLNITGNTWVASGTVGRSDGAGTAVIGGSKTLSATLDRIRITTVGGTATFDAGDVNIFWEF